VCRRIVLVWELGSIHDKLGFDHHKGPRLDADAADDANEISRDQGTPRPTFAVIVHHLGHQHEHKARHYI